MMMTSRGMRMLALALLAACAPSPAPRDGAAAPRHAGDAPPAAPPAAVRGDTSSIARLEREARAIAHAEGCAPDQCRTAPVGRRPCGGPRDYIVYCTATTDSIALFGKLDELARAEDERNRREGLASTCEFRAPPGVEVSGGRCVAASQGTPIM